MEEHYNSGIAFFNKTKIKEGAVKIEESIARQSNILVKNNRDRNNEHDKGDKHASNVHSRQTSAGIKQFNNGVAFFDESTLESGAVKIDKAIGHQENEIAPHSTDPEGNIIWFIYNISNLLFKIFSECNF